MFGLSLHRSTAALAASALLTTTATKTAHVYVCGVDALKLSLSVAVAPARDGPSTNCQVRAPGRRQACLQRAHLIFLRRKLHPRDRPKWKHLEKVIHDEVEEPMWQDIDHDVEHMHVGAAFIGRMTLREDAKRSAKAGVSDKLLAFYEAETAIERWLKRSEALKTDDYNEKLNNGNRRAADAARAELDEKIRALHDEIVTFKKAPIKLCGAESLVDTQAAEQRILQLWRQLRDRVLGYNSPGEAGAGYYCDDDSYRSYKDNSFVYATGEHEESVATLYRAWTAALRDRAQEKLRVALDQLAWAIGAYFRRPHSDGDAGLDAVEGWLAELKKARQQANDIWVTKEIGNRATDLEKEVAVDVEKEAAYRREWQQARHRRYARGESSDSEGESTRGPSSASAFGGAAKDYSFEVEWYESDSVKCDILKQELNAKIVGIMRNEIIPKFEENADKSNEEKKLVYKGMMMSYHPDKASKNNSNVVTLEEQLEKQLVYSKVVTLINYLNEKTDFYVKA